MSKPASHQLDVYGCWIHLATDRRAWSTLRRRVKSLDPKPSDAAGAVTYTKFSSDAGRHVQHYVVWINLAAVFDDHDLLDTVAHEACHVSATLLEHIGQPGGDSEALAYLVGWITVWLWKGCRP